MERLEIGKFEIIEKLREYDFSNDEIVDMFTYWLSTDDIEECVKDYLQDRSLKFNSNNEIEEY